MYLGILFLVLSQVSYGISNSLWKNPQRDMGSQSLVIARNAFTSIVFFLVCLFMDGFKDLDTEKVVRATGVCVINYFGLFFYLQSLRLRKVSEISALAKIGVIMGILGGYFYYDEKINTGGLVAILCIIISIVMVELWGSADRLRWDKGFFFAILSALFWGSNFLFKKEIQNVGPWAFGFILEISVLVMSFIMLLIRREHLRLNPLKHHWKEFSVLSLMGCTGLIFGNYSLKELPVILSSLLGLAYPLTTYLFAGIYHKEKLDRMQWIGIGLGLLGTIIYGILRE